MSKVGEAVAESPPRAAGRVVDASIALTVALCWFIVISRFMAWTIHPVVVLGQAALPVSLLPAWLVAVLAVVRRLPVRFVLSLLLVVVHVLAVLPAVGGRSLPLWARTDPAAPTGSPATTVGRHPHLRVLAANVYYGNDDARLARVLMSVDADVYVLSELSPTQHLGLEREGMFERNPYRLETEPDDRGQTLIVSRTPLSETVVSAVPGGWTPAATVTLDGRQVRIIAAHPRSPTDACCLDQLVKWLHWARDQGRSQTQPLVMAGDFNATRFFPAMGELFASGFIDAHEARGRGLSASWPAGGKHFDFPLVRFDHVLYRGGLAATSVRDVRIPGSDHLAVLADLVVR